MSLDLFELADDEEISIDFIDFSPPINGLYYATDGLGPAIGIAKRIEHNADFAPLRLS